MDDRIQKLSQLKEYFAARDDVLMAFLFGSRAKGYARRTSDWDIAVCLIKEDRTLEQRIWSDTEEILGAQTDLVVLNRAPASLAWTILRTGVPLAVKNRRDYLRLLLRSSHEANAWYHTAQRYHRVFERSASLSQEDREQLERAIQFLSQEITDYAKFRGLTWQEYQNDRVKKREVERWAEQLMNAAIDLAEVILASERRVIPETYRMIMRNLGAVPPFDQDDVCEKLAAWTELRNVLAHEYLDYRWKEIHAFIQETESFFRVLIERVKAFLEGAQR